MEIEFYSPYDTMAAKTTSPAPQSLNETKVESKVDPVESAKATEILNKQFESQLPVDLRTDSINDADKILNWSAGPDLESPQVDNPTLPGTGDQPISP